MISFRFLRSGSGDALYITQPSREGLDTQDELLYEWPPTPEMPFPAQLYRDWDGRRYRLWYGTTRNWIVIDPQGRRIDLPGTGDPLENEQRLWRVPAALCFLYRGDLPLHAAAVQVGGSAVVFAAPGHYGKTTLAAGFHQAGHRVLSEDITCVRLSPVPAIIPGPAALRVRRDVFDALRLPDVESVAENEQRVVLAIDPSRRGDCEPIPITAVMILRPGSDEMTFERVPAVEAIRDLMALSFKIETESERARAFIGIAELVRHIPVFNVYRPLKIEDLQSTVEQVASTINMWV